MNGPQVTFFGRLTQDPGELRFTPERRHSLHHGRSGGEHLP